MVMKSRYFFYITYIFCGINLSITTNAHGWTNQKSFDEYKTNETNKIMNEDSFIINEQKGIVGFWSETNQYVINFHVKGTLDSVRTGLVSSLPQKYQVSGLHVVVSGRLYKTEDLPPPKLGGQSIYWLEIAEITSDDVK